MHLCLLCRMPVCPITHGRFERNGSSTHGVLQRVAAGHIVSVQSLQHTSCAASVDVVNGIDHYVIKATTERRSRFNNYFIIVNSVPASVPFRTR
jgi:hypothetical protein